MNCLPKALRDAEVRSGHMRCRGSVRTGLAVSFGLILLVAIALTRLPASSEPDVAPIDRLGVDSSSVVSQETPADLPALTGVRVDVAEEAADHQAPVASEQASVEEPEDRSTWGLYRWRQFHAARFLARYEEGETLGDRMFGIKAVSELAIATTLDSMGRADEHGSRTPLNDGELYGFHLNGTSYGFRPEEFPEYVELFEVFAVMGTPPQPGGPERVITEETVQAVLNRLAEAEKLIPGLEAR